VKKTFENLTVFMEKVLANKKGSYLIGLITLIAPLYFFKTLYAVWFGPIEILNGFKSQNSTWLVFVVINFITFLTTLPAREKGRINQIITACWVVEMIILAFLDSRIYCPTCYDY